MIKVTDTNPLVFELMYGPLDGQVGFRGSSGMLLGGVTFTHFDNGKSFSECLAMPGYINLPFMGKRVAYKYKGNLRYGFAGYRE